MATRASVLELFGPDVRILDVDLVAEGEPTSFRLAFEPGANLVEAARILVRRRMPLAEAHAAMTRLVDDGAAEVRVPCVEDAVRLECELRAAGVVASLVPGAGPVP